jgi:hypothetical protein
VPAGFVDAEATRWMSKRSQSHCDIPILSLPHQSIVRLTYGAHDFKVEIMSFILHFSISLPAAGALSPAALLLRA